MFIIYDEPLFYDFLGVPENITQNNYQYLDEIFDMKHLMYIMKNIQNDSKILRYLITQVEK